MVKGGFYAVAVGKTPGIYADWASTEAQVKGFAGAKFKKFTSRELAEQFMQSHGAAASSIRTTAPPSMASSVPLSHKRSRNDDVEDQLDASAKRIRAAEPPSTVFYVVAVGKVPGIYTRWPHVMEQIEGVDRPVFRKFDSKAAAEAFLAGFQASFAQKVTPSVSRNMVMPLPSTPASSTSAATTTTTTITTAEAAVATAATSPSPSPSPLSTTTPFNAQTGPPTRYWYAVAKGRETGVFDTWAQAKVHVENLFSAVFKKFPSREEAQAFVTSYQQKARSQSSEPDPRDASTLVAFCDGSALQNGRYRCQAGFACIFPHNMAWNIAKKLREQRATNNRAEYFAALEAMKRANAENPAQDQVLYIFSDSMLLIRSMTEWISTWQKNQWRKADGNPVLNRDLLELLIQEQGKRRILWRHVKAHTGKQDWKSKWNDVADQQAKQVAMAP